MTLNIPREQLDAEPLDIWREHRSEVPGANLAALGRQVLAQALEEAGVDQGAYDERIAAWLGGFELSTAVTVASWIVRAYEAGEAKGAHAGASHIIRAERDVCPVADCSCRTSPARSTRRQVDRLPD